MSQAWKVALTPRQRWEIAQLTFAREAVFKGREEQRRLYRFRQAFGILAPSQMLVDKQRVNDKLVEDNATKAVFQITAENLELLTKLLDTIPNILGVTTLILEPVLQTLEAAKDGKEIGSVEGIPAYDPASEDWTPPKIPAMIEGWQHFPEAMLGLLRANESYDAFRKAFLAAWVPEKGEPESQEG